MSLMNGKNGRRIQTDLNRHSEQNSALVVDDVIQVTKVASVSVDQTA